MRDTGWTAMFVNLSHHPSADWTLAQRAECEALAQPLRDWPFPAVAPTASEDEVAAQAAELAAELVEEGAAAVLVQGESTLTWRLVNELRARAIPCYCATTERLVTQVGEIKQSRFQYVRLREYR